VSARSARIERPDLAQLVVGAATFAALAVSLAFGRAAFGVVVGLVLVLACVELRRMLAETGSVPGTVAAAGATAALAWLGHAGRLEDLPWVLAVLLLGLLALRVLLLELSVLPLEGSASDAAMTVAAAGTVGILGAHVLLIRALPRVGLRGVVAFGVLAAAVSVASVLVDRRSWVLLASTERRRSLQGAVGGLLAAAGVGAVLGLVLDPPLDPASGAVMGAGMGVLLPVGDLAGEALGAQRRLRSTRGRAARVDGVFPLVDGPLLAAPFFYWAYRTLVI
jgi:hypothetical protein